MTNTTLKEKFVGRQGIRVAVLLTFACACAGSAFATDRYTAWTGKGDGHSWKDANNWKGADGDSDPANWKDGVRPTNAYHNFITIDTDVEDFTGTLTNDLSHINYLDKLTITGSKAITIYSKDYQFGFRSANADALYVTATGEVTFDCRIEVYSYPYFGFTQSPKVSFKREVYSAGGRWRMRTSYQDNPETAEMHFYGAVTGITTVCTSPDDNPGYFEFDFGSGHVYFHKPVTLAHARKLNGHYKITKFHFLTTGNYVDLLELAGYGKVCCDCENAFDERQVMKFYPWYTQLGGNSIYSFGTYDQVFDRIESAETKNTAGEFQHTCWIGDGSDMTLTLKGTANATTYAQVRGNTTVVWDSSALQTQTFCRATHVTTGDLVAKSGTIVLDKNTTFLQVPKVRIGANGRIVLGANQTAAPFASTAALDVVDGGKLVVPDGVTVTFRRVQTADGMVYGSGKTYTAANASWLAGGGSVTCTESITCWKSATGGTWADTSKWTGALPDAVARANITAAGSPYTVSVASDTALTNTALDIAGPATVSVQSGVNFTWRGAPAALETDGPVFALRDGAVFETSGDTYWTNFTGKIDVGSDDASVTSRLTIAGGKLTFLSAKASDYRLQVKEGGLVEVKNDGVLHPTDKTWENCSFALLGGRLVFSDTAKYAQGGSWHTIFGSGEVVFEDDSVYQAGVYTEDPRGGTGTSYACSTRPYFAPFDPGLENAARLTFKDRARFAGDSGTSFYIDGSYCGTRDYNPGSSAALKDGYSFVTFASDQSHVIGGMVVGKDEGTSEMRLTNGSLALQAWKGSFDIGLNNSTGRVVVAGGTLTIPGYGGSFYGLNIGQRKAGQFVKSLGEFFLSSGSVTLSSGYQAIGCGAAVGRYVQVGGKFTESGAGTSVLVGLAGGDGLLAVSNGTYSARGWAWVGGSTNANHQTVRDYCSYDGCHGATGRLVVSAADPSVLCSAFFTEGLYVGQDGTGEIEIGRASTVEAAVGSLTSNYFLKLENGAQSTLRYTFAEAGVGFIALGTDLNISSGAKLVVDATRYTGRSRTFPLVTAKTRTGAFAADDITLLLPEGYQGEVEQPAVAGTSAKTVLRVKIRRKVQGAAIFIR